MLSVGIILHAPKICHIRRADHNTNFVNFHCVVDKYYNISSKFPLLHTPCEDPKTKNVKQLQGIAACSCKTMHWFLQAPLLYPNTSFVAKVEIDSIIHY